MSVRAPFAAGKSLRFVALAGSFVSDWGNPVATSARAVLSAIAAAGHDVSLFERRGNPALSALLANRGSRAYKTFTERYPRLRLRTYDLPGGWQRTVWFGAEIGTADAVIALPGTPEELLPEIIAVRSPHLVRLIDESFASYGDGFRLVRAGADLGPAELAFGPAVETVPTESAGRSKQPLLVAYDDAVAAQRIAKATAALAPVTIVTGTADLPAWTYLPEIELPSWYARHLSAVVIAAGDSPWSEARRLLPLASGCEPFDPENRSDLSRGDSSIPAPASAQVQAARIVEAVRSRLGR